MVYQKQIRLYPTNMYCTLIIGEDTEKVNQILQETYGVKEDFTEFLDSAGTFTVEIPQNGKYVKTILCYLKDFDNQEFVHEATHVVQHLSDVCNLNINYQTQEMMAYYMSYLAEEFEILKRGYE